MKLFHKNCLFVCLLLITSTSVLAKNALLDSLKNELSIRKRTDEQRAVLLNSIANKHYGINQDSLKEYAKQGRDLAHKIGFLNGEARGWFLLGVFHLSKGELDSASEMIGKAMMLYEEVEDVIGMSSCYDLMGTITNMRGDYIRSIVYLKKALKMARQEGKEYNAAGIISNIGGAYLRMGEFDKAIESHKEAIAVYNSLGLKKKALTPLSNIAIIYTKQGRNLEALEYFQKCLSGYREHGNKIFGANTLQNIGFVYTSIGENDKALPYIQESIKINKELGNESNISSNYISLGIIYAAKNNKDRALEYYNRALVIANKINNKEVKLKCYSNIGSLHFKKQENTLALKYYKKSLELSLELGGKFEIAESYIALGHVYYELGYLKEAMDNVQNGIVLAEELSLLKSKVKANLIKSRIFNKQGKYKNAYETYKTYTSLSDSLQNNENIKKITQLEYDYKYKLKLDSANLRELKLTNTVNSTNQKLEKSQRNLLLGVIIFLLTALLLGGIIFFLKLRNAKSKTQNIAIEQKLLRSQMTPHFIFNALSVLQGMILNKEEGKAVSYLSKFSKLLRIILENSREKTVMLKDELVAVEDYLGLQNIEVKNPFKYSINVDKDINQETLKVPPMLMQPFIENAIEHAFGSIKENREIDIDLVMQDESLVCTIKDNGMGIDQQKANQKSNKKSFATTITSERLSLLSKDFKTEGSIKVEDRKKNNSNGTLVTLTIPYKVENA